MLQASFVQRHWNSESTVVIRRGGACRQLCAMEAIFGPSWPVLLARKLQTLDRLTFLKSARCLSLCQKWRIPLLHYKSVNRPSFLFDKRTLHSHRRSQLNMLSKCMILQPIFKFTFFQKDIYVNIRREGKKTFRVCQSAYWHVPGPETCWTCA